MSTANIGYASDGMDAIKSPWNLLLGNQQLGMGNALARNQLEVPANEKKTRAPSAIGNTVVPNPLQNHFLASLPQLDFATIASQLELVSLPLHFALHEPAQARMNNKMDVYFPITAIISLISALEDGSTMETAVVGNEGMVGMSLFMGGVTNANRAIVQSPGLAYRIKATWFDTEFARGGALQQRVFLYTQTLMAQMSQNAVCNRRHSVQQQVARRLLLSHDRADTDTLDMTHDLLATILGVRREGITAAAGALQRAGVIRYSRGRVEITNREGLEEFACECYEVVRSESRRLFAYSQHNANFFHRDALVQ